MFQACHCTHSPMFKNLILVSCNKATQSPSKQCFRHDIVHMCGAIEGILNVLGFQLWGSLHQITLLILLILKRSDYRNSQFLFRSYSSNSKREKSISFFINYLVQNTKIGRMFH